MALRGNILIPSTVTRTLLCIDSAKEHEFSGRLMNPYVRETLPFQNSKHLIDLMERFFDDITFPQKYYTQRTFTGETKRQEQRQPDEIVRYHEDTLFEAYQGEIATLIFQVRFRQNAEWQGSVNWLDNSMERQFRSTLDFFHLIDDVISRSMGGSVATTWDIEH